MLKNELVERMLEALNTEHGRTFTRRDVEAFLSTFADIAGAELLGGGEISFGAKLGKLKVKDIKARSGINPRTGKSIEIAARRRVCFVPSGEMRESLCEQNAE